MPYKDKTKRREYQKLWVRKRRLEFFGGKHCKECGSTNKLQLHHKNPKEKIAHHIWSWSKERRDKEIAKCIVLCQKCHLKLHNPRTTKHGTTMYSHGCKCKKCKKACADYRREYRRRKLTLKRNIRVQLSLVEQPVWGRKVAGAEPATLTSSQYQ